MLLPILPESDSVMRLNTILAVGALLLAIALAGILGIKVLLDQLGISLF
jgi:hypothetical protein